MHHLNLGTNESVKKMNISGDITLNPQAVMSTATLKRVGTQDESQESGSKIQKEETNLQSNNSP